MGPPDAFGESALFPDDEVRVRAARVAAGERGASLLAFSVLSVETLVGFELQAASLKLYYRKMVSSVLLGKRLLVHGLEVEDIDALVGATKEVSFAPGEVVAAEGELDERLLIIQSGVALVRRADEPQALATLRRGDCLGEQALVPAESMRRVRRKASVVVEDGQGLKALSLSLAALSSLPGRQVAVWRTGLVEEIVASAVGGVDAVAAARLGSGLTKLTAVKQTNGKKGGNRLSASGNVPSTAQKKV
jgi:hypothetical protein